MRYRFLSVALLLTAAPGHPATLFVGGPTPAMAQVTVNPKALQPLGGGNAPLTEVAPTHAASHNRASAHRHRAATTSRHPAPVATEQPGSAKPAAPPPGGSARTGSTAPPAATPPPSQRSLVHEPPVVPLAPPPPVTLAPLEPPPPAHPAPAPQPVPVVAGATGEALPIPDGLRLTFGSGSADLNPETDAALQKLAHETADKPDANVTVLAYAAGSPDDPSTPRRLALSRALAARGVLLAAGINSTHIYLRALGSNTGEGPPDRVDVTVTSPAAAAKPEP